MKKRTTTLSIRNGYTKKLVLEVNNEGINLLAPLDGDSHGCVLGNWWLTPSNARKLRDALTKAIGDENGR